MATPVLLHACCGPCSTYTVKRLREQDIEPTALWYNPNIHPFREHNQRLESMQVFSRQSTVPLVVLDGYEFIRFLRLVSGHEGDRCTDCYRLRLGRAAAEARQRGLSAFTTTLLISPYQDHDRLREVGQEVAQEHGVEFYYEDLRPGFPESRRLTRELGLYRQQYCGCIYSEWERYARAKIGADTVLSVPALSDSFEEEKSCPDWVGMFHSESEVEVPTCRDEPVEGSKQGFRWA